jgi:SET and MYND domain-containing protein
MGDFMFVRARRPLAAGEELTFSYMDPMTPFKDRSHQIMRDHGFVCTCELCLDQEQLEQEPHKAAVRPC